MRKTQIAVMVFLLLVFISSAIAQERNNSSIKGNLEEFSGEGFNMFKAWRPSEIIESAIFKKLKSIDIIEADKYFSHVLEAFFLESEELAKVPLVLEFSATNDSTEIFLRLCDFPDNARLIARFREGYAHYGLEEETVGKMKVVSVQKEGSSEPVPAMCQHGTILDSGDVEALLVHYQSERNESSKATELCIKTLNQGKEKTMTLDFLEGDSDWARADLFTLLNPPDDSMAVFRAAQGIKGFCSQSHWGDQLVVKRIYYFEKAVDGKTLESFALGKKNIVIRNMLGDFFGSRERGEKCLESLKTNIKTDFSEDTFSITVTAE